MRSCDGANPTGGYVDADTVNEQFQHKLDAVRDRLAKIQE